MSCCSSSPKRTAAMLTRIGFGLSLAFLGVAHYRDTGFADMVGSGLGGLQGLGMMWGYLLPGLMIVGGILLAFRILPMLGTWLAGLALLSIPVGVMMKSALTGMDLSVTMPQAVNAFLWILVYLVAARAATACCGSCCVPAAKSSPKEFTSTRTQSSASAPSVAMPTAKPAAKRKPPVRKKAAPKKKAGGDATAA